MSDYAHLTADERDRLAALKADGLSLRAIARALGRAASTISRELRRNALDSGAYRPHVADGAYMLRRQRAAFSRRTRSLRAMSRTGCPKAGRRSRSPDGCGSGSRSACGRSARRRSTAVAHRFRTSVRCRPVRAYPSRILGRAVPRATSLTQWYSLGDHRLDLPVPQQLEERAQVFAKPCRFPPLQVLDAVGENAPSAG